MRLKDRTASPVGGFYYDDPETGQRIFTDGNFQKLINGVREWYKLKGIPIPEKLAELIEDSICIRQPPGKCYYTKGTGDQISRFIHTAASVIDRVAGTQLEKRARGCGGCSGRRVRIN